MGHQSPKGGCSLSAGCLCSQPEEIKGQMGGITIFRGIGVFCHELQFVVSEVLRKGLSALGNHSSSC